MFFKIKFQTPLSPSNVEMQRRSSCRGNQVKIPGVMHEVGKESVQYIQELLFETFCIEQLIQIQVKQLRRTTLNRYYVDFLKILMNFHLRPL